MKEKTAFFFILSLQTASSVWYLFPEKSHSHVSGGFIKLVIFSSIILSLSIITAATYSFIKPPKLPWKVPFIVLIIMVLLVLFY